MKEPPIRVFSLFVFQFSLSLAEATIGQQLLDIRYHNDKGAGLGAESVWMTGRQKVFHALLMIGGPWLSERAGDLAGMTSGVPYSEKVR